MNLHRLYLIPTTGELDAPNVWPLHAGDRYDGLSLMATDEPIITLVRRGRFEADGGRGFDALLAHVTQRQEGWY